MALLIAVHFYSRRPGCFVDTVYSVDSDRGGFPNEVTLKKRLQISESELSPMAVMEKLAMIQMIDVWILTRDDRWLVPVTASTATNSTQLRKSA